MVILTLLAIQSLFEGSWSHHLGETETGYTFSHAKSDCAPLRLLTERVSFQFHALICQLLFQHRRHQESFKTINYTAHRITRFLSCFCCSVWTPFPPSLQWEETGYRTVLQMKRRLSFWTKVFWSPLSPAVGNKLFSLPAHILYPCKFEQQNKVHRVASPNCRWGKAETKATVTLMACLVIRRALMYVLNGLFYLFLPLCLLLFVSQPGSTSFFINAVFRERFFCSEPST